MALILMQTITRSFHGGHVIVVIIVGAADGAMAMAMVHDIMVNGGRWQLLSWRLVAEEVIDGYGGMNIILVKKVLRNTPRYRDTDDGQLATPS